ncbi:hypothetical protein BDK51DRAFT_42699 [Blyttiomyces helicus]|uniref:Cation-transporting P-type ATPase C-terminal domain-containing protein n=1 Tax=Blyttiomyces helicus TaxID=388810 RepID=A0A4P9WIG5_9FUNG|nr:hypothetical protein BDK51DRAFT_42699 [Blyttiomyces helicus]|eukprot:RKO91795.1 hypothetical protein BDK51DRAFT_42699 [Blyttiomyces helicus]
MGYASYWVDLFSKQDGEVLVDNEVLSWSYLEGGVIECIGSLVTFFTVLASFGITPGDASNAQSAGGYFMPHSPNLTLASGGIVTGAVQFEALKQAQSAFYLSVLIIQMWNLFACKSKLKLPFGRHVLQ